MSNDDQKTPGPWKDCGPNEDGERCIWGADGSCVAVTIPVGNPDERERRSIENASAIAAAPDLLEALDRVINDNGYLGYTSPETLNHIETVRDKARGENHD